jgi:hypothetical protein
MNRRSKLIPNLRSINLPDDDANKEANPLQLLLMNSLLSQYFSYGYFE